MYSMVHGFIGLGTHAVGEGGGELAHSPSVAPSCWHAARAPHMLL